MPPAGGENGGLSPFSAAAALAALIALLFLLAYAVSSRRERGWDPAYVREVYFAAGAPAAALAARFHAAPAAPAQVALYAAEGGTPAPRRARGAWLFGPKPPRGTPGVLPFDARDWFQQRGQGESAAG